MTFGSPKVGDKAFATLFKEKVTDNYRMVMKHDQVPRLTRQSKALSSYTHVSRKIILPETTTRNSVLDQMRRRGSVTGIGPHFD